MNASRASSWIVLVGFVATGQSLCQCQAADDTAETMLASSSSPTGSTSASASSASTSGGATTTSPAETAPLATTTSIPGTTASSAPSAATTAAPATTPTVTADVSSVTATTSGPATSAVPTVTSPPTTEGSATGTATAPATASDGGAPNTAAGGAGGVDGAGGSAATDTAQLCPADHSFCADFETSDLPDEAQYFRNAAPAEWTADFEVDTTVFREGTASLRVRTTTEASESAYKMLAVPTPGNVFWARVYWRSDAVLGQGTLSASEHNRFMIAASQPEPNSSDALEFAEDCGIALNSHDQVYRPEGGSSTCDAPLRLEPDTWYCVELSFNGETGDTQVYIDGDLKIDAKAWGPGKGNFTYLKVGVDSLHPIVRNVWFDALAVGPTRPHCL